MVDRLLGGLKEGKWGQTPIRVLKKELFERKKF